MATKTVEQVELSRIEAKRLAATEIHKAREAKVQEEMKIAGMEMKEVQSDAE